MLPLSLRREWDNSPVIFGQHASGVFQKLSERADLPVPLTIAHARVDQPVDNLDARNLGDELCHDKPLPTAHSDTLGEIFASLASRSAPGLASIPANSRAILKGDAA